jgi:hypothetical protein
MPLRKNGKTLSGSIKSGPRRFGALAWTLLLPINLMKKVSRARAANLVKKAKTKGKALYRLKGVRPAKAGAPPGSGIVILPAASLKRAMPVIMLKAEVSLRVLGRPVLPKRRRGSSMPATLPRILIPVMSSSLF